MMDTLSVDILISITTLFVFVLKTVSTALSFQVVNTQL